LFTSDEKPAIGKQINRFLLWLDRIPLWWTGILIVVVFFSPYFILGDGCIFEINDQLDESIMNYMLPARHLWDGSTVYPEMLGGVNASGMQPSAILFLPLYCLFSARVAFLIQYMICFVLAFLGMYLLVKESTESSILAVIAGACFCVLPLYPVYGLSEFGIPLVTYAFLCLWKRKRILPALMCTLLFGLTSHLVYTGYVVLGLWLLALLVAFFQKRKNKWPVLGFAELLVTYVIVNWSLILEILVGDSSYVSHREEMVSSATPFFETFWSLFRNSAQHAPSLHKYLILPIVIFLLLGAFCKKEETDRMIYKAAVINFLFLIGIALFYAFCHMTVVVDFKNSVTGFLHYFQIHRFYWLYPADWYLEFALAAAVEAALAVLVVFSREGSLGSLVDDDPAFVGCERFHGLCIYREENSHEGDSPCDDSFHNALSDVQQSRRARPTTAILRLARRRGQPRSAAPCPRTWPAW